MQNVDHSIRPLHFWHSLPLLINKIMIMKMSPHMHAAASPCLAI